MSKLVLEVGMKLDKDLIYYHELLQEHGLKLVFSIHTHDVYYSKDSNFDGMSESQMKNACVRLRYCQKLNSEENDFKDIRKKENELIKQGYKKVLDTSKLDFHYCNKKMKGRVQIQGRRFLLRVQHGQPAGILPQLQLPGARRLARRGCPLCLCLRTGQVYQKPRQVQQIGEKDHLRRRRRLPGAGHQLALDHRFV